MREKTIQSAILKWLRAQPDCWAFNTGGGARASLVGAPDIVGCFMGCFFAIEVKQPGKEPTKIQRYTLRRIHAAGGLPRLCFVAHSLDQVRAVFVDTREGLVRDRKKLDAEIEMQGAIKNGIN